MEIIEGRQDRTMKRGRRRGGWGSKRMDGDFVWESERDNGAAQTLPHGLIYGGTVRSLAIETHTVATHRL